MADESSACWRDLAAAMVREQIEARRLGDPPLLAAMARVPRHRFVPHVPCSQAYDDGPLPTLDGQTISQPYMVALMTHLLAVRPGARVLEIGTGSGYQAAVLAELGAEVLTLKRHVRLARQAAAVLHDLGYGSRVTVIAGDGSRGWREGAPYQGIVVTAGAPQVPAALPEQLAEDGRLVIPVGTRHLQDLVVLHRRAGGLEKTLSVPCRFVPLVGEDGWKHGDGLEW